jgi:hypothetical protein
MDLALGLMWEHSPHFSRGRVAQQLRDRILNPAKINQQMSSLCGPASFLFCLATRNPEKYAKYIIDLYEHGAATIEKLKVKPGRDCKSYKIPPNAIDEVDWIGLASLRDSENDLFDYDSVSDQFPGITLPDKLRTWFSEAGYSSVEKKTNLLYDKSLYVLLQAHQKKQSGSLVCLFVGANIFSGRPNGKSFPDHWVVLNSAIRIDNKPVGNLLAKGKTVNHDQKLLAKRIDFNVYTWGNSNYAVNAITHNVSVELFLDYFYGYVAAN